MRLLSVLYHVGIVVVAFFFSYGCSNNNKTLKEATDEYEKDLQQLQKIVKSEDTVGLDNFYKQFIARSFSTIKHFSTSSLAFRIMQDIYFDLDLSQRVEAFALLPHDSLKNYKRLNALYCAFEKEVATSEGHAFIDFGGLTPDGDSLVISQVVGRHKYVLLDFWASWCPSCCKEMPALKQFYEKNGDVVEVIGISLDKRMSDWQTAIDTLGISWQQVSDLKGWDCAYATLYGIRSIPTTVLINQEGIIVARNKSFIQMQDIILGRKN